jgi:hypothetical protein
VSDSDKDSAPAQAESPSTETRNALIPEFPDTPARRKAKKSAKPKKRLAKKQRAAARSDMTTLRPGALSARRQEGRANWACEMSADEAPECGQGNALPRLEGLRQYPDG